MSSIELLLRNQDWGRTDSIVSEATVEEDDVEEIERDTPIPDGRSRFNLPIYPKENLRVPHQVAAEEIEDEQEENEEADEAYEDDSGVIHTHYTVPAWFPKRIKKVFLVDRRGGQFTFKELDRVTRYRNAMERVKRIKWKIYLEAGLRRWQLQRCIRRMRPLAKTTPRLVQYQKVQFEKSDEIASNAWKRLEKLHLGLRVLDEVIDLNFRQERIIYEKKLGGRFRV